MFRRHLIWVLALAVLTPAVASAQWGPQSQYGQARTLPGYDAGYERGLRAGGDDLRRRSAFNFSVHVDFRRGDIGYRSQFGNRDRYRNEFRRGFEIGYRAGYHDNRGGAWGPGRAVGRVDVAAQQGYSDGYEAGVNDARGRRQFDPVGERRYRSADRGYNRSYGPKAQYQANYRTGFVNGYEAGYRSVAGRYGYDRRW